MNAKKWYLGAGLFLALFLLFSIAAFGQTYTNFTRVAAVDGFAIGTFGNEEIVIDGNKGFFGSFNYTGYEAGATIHPNRVVEIDTVTGKLQEATKNSFFTVGICVDGAAVSNGKEPILGWGLLDVVADGAVELGYPVKAAHGGKVTRFIDSVLSGTIMETATGGGFVNQPANDSISLVSDSVSDALYATVYGTTNGGDGTVVTEVIEVTGTTPVTSVKTDWGLILGIELDTAAVGTITVSETSDSQAITTIAAEATSKGVITVATETRAFNQKPTIVADDATTKYFAVIGTAVDHTALTEKATALTGATPVTLSDEYNTVTKLLVGDVESTRTVTLKVGAVDDTRARIGKALESATAENDLFKILFLP